MSRIEEVVLSSVYQWASQHLDVIAGGAGLDMRQLMQRWTWWRFAQGQSVSETFEARSALPVVLQELGAQKKRLALGAAAYEWWTVAPKGWIAGRRSLPNDLLGEFDASHFAMTDWKWENMRSLGEAAGSLLWTFRHVEVVGVLGEDVGYLAGNPSLTLIPGYPVKGDQWRWEAANRAVPLGAGRIGVRTYELQSEVLQEMSVAATAGDGPELSGTTTNPAEV